MYLNFFFFFCFFNDTATTEIYTLSLHDAPRSSPAAPSSSARSRGAMATGFPNRRVGPRDRKSTRLNSSHVATSYAVFCLKKKKKQYTKCLFNKKKKK